MESIWSKTTELREFNSLMGDKKTDVLVIGGGITGILTAYFLKEKGAAPVLIEAGRIAEGVTRNTTAKITSQHGLIYNKLTKNFGQEQARQYAEANENAVRAYRELIREKEIDCDFREATANLYAVEKPETLEKEYKAAAALGLPAKLTDKFELPMEVKGVLRFEGQAQFNPLAFLSKISEGLEIYENTRAVSAMEGRVITERGAIDADRIILACHFPFINTPGYYFMRMHQERSYAIALENAGVPEDAYLGIDGRRHSFRSYRGYTILGGEGHRTGDNKSGGRYENLIKASRTFYPESRVFCRWSAQDCMTHDGVPYIGKFSSETAGIYVATGFKKWGMTSAMVSAMMLSDEVLGKKTEYTIFSPQRHNLAPSIAGILEDGARSVAGLAGQMLTVPSEKLGEVPVGYGTVVEHRGEKMGVYKESDGTTHIVTTKCPHMGCQLTWNPDDASWDCPCHGSRFDYRGRLINNPAQKDLEEIVL